MPHNTPHNEAITELHSPAIPAVWRLLGQISDPEIPVLSIVELGMIRQVEQLPEGWRIAFTPTYSGCPATEMLLNAIEEQMQQAGFTPVSIEIQLSPAWTTDWMGAEARKRLQEYGIAPPNGHCCDHSQTVDQPAHCPRCSSHAITLLSEFGSTACKAQYRCNDCLEPFDYFKCI